MAGKSDRCIRAFNSPFIARCASHFTCGVRTKHTGLAAVGVLLFVWLYVTARREEADFSQHLSMATKEFDYVRKLERACGPLCSAGGGSFSKSLFFRHRAVSVKCDIIFGKDVFIQAGHGRTFAPQVIPGELLHSYTLEGKIPVSSYYFDQKYLNAAAKTSVWDEKLVESYVLLATRGKLEGNYGDIETNHLRSSLRQASVNQGRVLVIGSENPWVEACVLEAGARSVLTLEYGQIRSEHNAINTITPEGLQRLFFNGSLGTFDVIVSFSSVEHSGLGRYGDALNPWGDVLEIARAHCITNPGGKLVLAVMCGEDELEFNAHRRYGPERWPYLVSNWRQIHKEDGGSQVVHVFEKA